MRDVRSHPIAGGMAITAATAVGEELEREELEARVQRLTARLAELQAA
jgi:hypothetical protein